MPVKIYKYELRPPPPMSRVSTVSLPKGAKIRHFGTQQYNGEESLFFWAEVNTDAPEELVAFQVIATGIAPPEDGWEWVSTVQFNSHHLVFHIYKESLKN